MKNLYLLLALTLTSSVALAESPSVLNQPSISVAVVETGVTLDWQALESARAAKGANDNSEQKLNDRTQAINERIGNRLEQQLQEKIDQQLDLDF